MRALVILACVLAASATPASTGAPATGTPYTEQSGMPLSPIHYVTPVYDNNYAPTAGAVASAPCAGDCGGAQSTGGLVTPVYDVPSSSNFSSYNEPVKVQAWSGPAPAGQTQGQTLSQSTGPAAPPATPAQQAKKAQINFEIVTIAKMVDGIETHLRNTAAKIDSQQVPSLSALRANLTVAKARLNSEEARVNSTFAAGKITKHRHTVALKAIRFVRSNLRRCFRALRVIEQGRAAVQRNLTAVAARRAVPKPQVQRKPAGRAGAKRRLGPRRRRIVKRQVRRANRAIKKARRAVIGKKGKKGLGKKGGKRRRFVKKQIRRASRAIKKARRVALKKGGKKGGRRLRKGKKGGRRLRKGKKGGRRLRKGKKGARRFRKGKKGGRRVRKAGRGRRRIARRVPKVVQRAKARQFGNETVSLASRVDKLKKRLISDARRVDQNKTAAALTRRDLNEINRMQKAVKVEFARIRGALGRKLITRKTFRREIKALKFLNSELAKCRRAANLVLGDRQRVKQRVVANKIRGAPAATVKAWLFNDTVRLASEIDKVKKFLVDEASRVDSKKPVSAMVRQTISSIETLAKRVADERIRVIEAKRSRKVSLVVAKKAFAAIRLMNAQLTRCRKAARLILADRVKAKAAQSAKTQRKEIVRLNEKAVSLAALVDTIKAALVRDAKLIDAGISGPANKGWLNALQTNITQAEQKLAAERRAVIDDVKKGKITVQYRQRQERALAIMEKQIQRVRKALSVLQRRK